jgi:cytochrome P450
MALAEQITLVMGLLTAVVVLLRLIRKWRNGHGGQNRKAHLPPGSIGWPLIGETWSYYRSLASSNPSKFVEDRRKRYNSAIFRTHIFGDELIMSADPYFNKYAMQNDERIFQSKFPKFLLNLTGKYAFFALHSELLRKLHGLTVNMMRPERLRADFMDEILSLFDSTTNRWADMEEIFLQNEISQMVLNLIAKQLLDISPSKETTEIRKLFVEFIRAIVAIPTKIPGTTHAKGLKARKNLITKIVNIIEERKKHPEVVHRDMLARILKEGSVANTQEIICDCILNLLLAGHENSSKAMLFSVKYLSDCPKALAQLREEHDIILRNKGDNKKLDWNDYTSMKFTQCVINETLRLGNFAPGAYKENKEDIKVKGYDIPKGSLIFLSTMAPHLDENFYSNALKFDPWRWKLDQDISNDSLFVPFGAGPRLCSGYHLAKLELSIFLHMFVTRFRWDVLADDHASYFPFPQLSRGFPIRLHLRT